MEHKRSVAATEQVCAWEMSSFRTCDACSLAHILRSMTRNHDRGGPWEICETAAHQVPCVGAGMQDNVE
jgi:hypothetical protein